MARVGVCVGARHMRTRPRGGEIVGGSSGGGELSPGGGSTEVRSDSSRKILLKRVDEHQQPMVQLRGFGGRTFRQRLKHRKQSY